MKKKVSFVDVRHDLLVEWNYERNEGLDPQAFAANSCQKVWWMCPYGHEWEASIASRVRGMGCPYDCCKLHYNAHRF